MFSFYSPWWLLGLLLLPLYWWYEYRWRHRRRVALPFSRYELLSRIKPQRELWTHVYPVLRLLLIFALVMAMARPRIGKARQDIQGAGVDIVIALDVSGSMLAVDFVPQNRLGAAKKVAQEFIRQREHDRIGIVTFSEYALTRCPLTTDRDALQQIISNIEVNREASATAIGMGLATAVARLRESKAASRVIILITDGVNNTGEIDPFTAADMAHTYGIKVYPIGVGSNGVVDFPVSDPLFGQTYQKVKIEMDMNTLNRIASITGTGSAALATSTEQLSAILQKIDHLEKSKYHIRNYYDYRESFPFFLWLAIMALLSELVLKVILLRIIPE